MSKLISRSRTRVRRARWLPVLPLCLALLALTASGAQAAKLQKGFWGPTQIEGVSQFPVYEQLGVTLYQYQLRWELVAPTKPVNPRDPADPAYLWPAELDTVMAESKAHKMSVMLMLVGTPPWANGNRTSEYAPTNPADYADFAGAASRRYPSVRRWMIWGEPSRSNNWKPFVQQPLGQAITAASKPVPRRYARLLDAAYGRLKAVRKTNLVIGGNTYTTGEIRPIDWVQNLRLPNGRPPRMDLYGHNPFTLRRPSLTQGQSGSNTIDYSDLGIFDKLIQRNLGRPRHKRIRLFLSEFTIPTAPDSEFNFYVPPKTQADWITRAFKIARTLGADTLGWIHLRDDQLNTGNFASAGGLLTFDGVRKPGFYAFMRGGLTAAQRAREARG
jgi:hypothetical protein